MLGIFLWEKIYSHMTLVFGLVRFFRYRRGTEKFLRSGYSVENFIIERRGYNLRVYAHSNGGRLPTFCI